MKNGLQVKKSSTTPFLKDILRDEVEFSGVVIIDKETALECIKNHVNARPISRSHVAYLKRLIAEGDWREDHPMPIVFDSQMILIDGQHRLKAIAEIGNSVRANISTGLDNSISRHIDNGKIRGFRHRVILHQGGKTANDFAVAIVNIIDLNFDKKTPDEAIAIYNKYKEGIDKVCEMASACKSKVTVRAVLAPLAICIQRNYPLGVAFANSVIKPDGDCQQGRMFRDWFSTKCVSHHGFDGLINVRERCFYCFNRFQRGQDVSSVIRHKELY